MAGGVPAFHDPAARTWASVDWRRLAPATSAVPAVRRMSGMKHRADQFLVDRGLAESRTRAQALILAGKVFAGERRIDKAGPSTGR